MPERSALLQSSQLGKETTIGTGVAASKLPQAIGWAIAPAIETDVFTPTGQLVPSVVTPMTDMTNVAIEGRGSYSELAYIFNSALADVTPSTTDTSAKTWTYTPQARAEDTITSYTIEQGGAVRAQKAAGCIVTGFEMGFNRTTPVTVTGAGIGRLFQDNITLTVTPTGITEANIDPKHVDVWVDATAAGLGTTKLLRDFNVAWRCQSLRGPLWALNSAETSWASIVQTAPTFEMELTLQADAAGMALLGDMRTGATKFVRVKATSPVLAGAATVPYSLQIDFAGKITAVGDFEETEGVYTISFTLHGVYDTTWAKFMQVILVNKVTAL